MPLFVNEVSTHNGYLLFTHCDGRLTRNLKNQRWITVKERMLENVVVFKIELAFSFYWLFGGHVLPILFISRLNFKYTCE